MLTLANVLISCSPELDSTIRISYWWQVLVWSAYWTIFLSVFFTCHIIWGFNKREGYYLFHNAGTYHIETSPLICCPNQWTGFYVIGTSVLKKLKLLRQLKLQFPVSRNHFRLSYSEKEKIFSLVFRSNILTQYLKNLKVIMLQNSNVLYKKYWLSI